MRTLARSLDAAGLDALKEALANETRRERRVDRRKEAVVVAHELAGVVRGPPLDPRQAGVLREVDIRAPSPPPSPPLKPPLSQPLNHTEQEEREWVQAARQRNAMLSMKSVFADFESRGSKYVLDPDSRLACALHWTTFVFCLYTVFAEPYLLVLEHYTTDWQTNAPGFFVFLSVTSELFFFCDLFVGPFKGYKWLVPGGVGWKKELNLDRTLHRYATTWFALDLPSRMCPVQLAIFAANYTFQSSSIHALFVFSIMKLLMVVRIYDVLTSFIDQDIRYHRRVGLAKASLLAMTTIHWLACAWLIALARSTFGSENAADAAAGSFLDGCQERSILVDNNTITGQYLCSYYRIMQTVTTTAYGDMPATGFADRAFTLVCMLLGAALLYTSFVASLGSATGSDELDFIHQHNTLMDFIQFRSLSLDIMDDARSFYQHRWNSSRGFVDLHQLKKLPPNMRVPAFHHLYSYLRKDICFFQVRPPEDIFFWNFLIESFEHSTYMPGDVIRRCDDPEHYDALFIMLHGVVEEVHSDTGYIYRRHQGASWFGEVHEITGRKRGAALQVVEICDVLELDVSAIKSLFTMSTFKDFRKVLKDTCIARINLPGVARWKFYFHKHKKAILKIAKKIPQPAAPWPRTINWDEELGTASTKEHFSDGGGRRESRCWEGGENDDGLFLHEMDAHSPVRPPIDSPREQGRGNSLQNEQDVSIDLPGNVPEVRSDQIAKRKPALYFGGGGGEEKRAGSGMVREISAIDSGWR